MVRKVFVIHDALWKSDAWHALPFCLQWAKTLSDDIRSLMTGLCFKLIETRPYVISDLQLSTLSFICDFEGIDGELLLLTIKTIRFKPLWFFLRL